MVPLSLLFLLTSLATLIHTSSGLPYLGRTGISSLSQQVGNASDATDCNDLSWNLRPECWDRLDIPKWLTQWWETNPETCQEHHATFSSCFQQMAGIQQQQCDTIGDGLCSFPTNITAFSPQEAYVLYSIFGIWQWYFSMWQGIGNANLGAQGPVGKIVEAINPVKPSTQVLGEFLQALTAMTPLFKAPALIGRMSNTVETALRQSPGVLKQMFPSGTLNSQFVQVNGIYDGLSKIQLYYQANLTNALNLVQTSFTTFLDFSAEGGFIAPQASLQAQSNILLSSLQTFIVSSCLSQSDIFITLARDTNPHELVINGSLTSPHLVQCDYYDKHGVCSTWWYDASTNLAYGLSSLSDPQKNFYDLLQQLFENEWTTPPMLFAGALECAEYVKNTNSSNQPTLDLVTMQPRCISNTQVCVYDQSCEVNDPHCEFTGEYGGEDKLCKPAKEWLGNCGETYSTFSSRVPASYLGPMDTTPLGLEFCND